ncbi:unnamed protein product [Rhizophagus irregularis]|nr:unnamed protein product [Rhizophagus irregularis]CAB5389729.1 unnamed protein product [Rhizophagus irregularis]
MSSNKKIDDSIEMISSNEIQDISASISQRLPYNDDLEAHTTTNLIDDSLHNTIAESSNGSSHNRSMSRRDSIRHAVNRLSTMISGGNQDDTGREIPINPSNHPLIDPRTKKPFINNSITSSRYKIYDFLPKQIIYQFSKIANFYFLFVAILQSIPELSPTGRFTTIIPLSIFMSIAIAHEGFDDYRRHKQDQIENNKECSVLNVYKSNDSTTQHLGVWRKTKWRNVKVGDFVSVKAQEWIPADLLLLHSKGEEGACYIETAALDGETNLKQRQALKEINSSVTTPEALANFRATVRTENPNQDLYNFDGSISLANKKTCSLSNNQILLRGTILRNTPEIYGLVIFTGEETKLRMNASKNIRTKAPSIQRLMNKVVIIIFCFVITLAILCTVMSLLWDEDIGKESFYLPKKGKIINALASFIILFNTMIPISLYVTMEVIKLTQAYFINNDAEMYHQETDTPAEARTSTINEELGQVSYLFSDKTGTLTDNIMLFRKISVGGRAFMHDLDLRRIEEDDLLRMMKQPQRSKTFQRFIKRLSLSTRWHNRSQTRDDTNDGDETIQLNRSDSTRSGRFSMIAPNSTGPSPLYRRDSTSGNSLRSVKGKTVQQMKSTLDLLTILQHQTNTPFYEKARFFLLAIALCHTCVPEIVEETQDVFYQAASPDEFALVTAAKELGYIVTDRSMGSVSLKINNDGPNGLKVPDSSTTTYENYKILNVIEFSSKRKRMSVIYRLPDGRICLLCKGADSIVLERLRDPVNKPRKGKDKKEKYDEERSNEKRPLHGLRVDTNIVGRNANNQSESSVISSISNTPITPSSTHEFYASSISIRQAHERSLSIRTVDSDRSVVDLLPMHDEKWLYSQTMYHIQDFATEGLRTLLYAHRFMDEEEYTTWNNLYQEASTALVDRQQKLEDVAELIERDLEITGATAIEDKLQNGVPETIDNLRRAGIRVWMLTGDKKETAINIGYSCSLIKDYSTTIIIDSNTDLKSMMKRALKDVKNGKAQHPVAIVDGATLMKIEKNPDMMEIFVDLGILCEAVICCRVSPSQKALVVRNIRSKLTNSVTLAIGDGANDIAMIQESHVGIGITGREGLQAARSSDYSIAQFRFLSNLLFVHGRWSYVRVSKFVLGTFYKCMCFYLTQGLFQLFTGFSGTSLYEQWTLSFYNTLFSSLPVIVIGMFEKDLNMKTVLGVPELYRLGQRNGGFNLKLFFTWMGAGIFHAFIIIGIPFLIHGLWDGDELGIFGTPQLYELGMTVYSCVVFVVTIKIAYLECHNWSIITHITSILTLIGWYLYQTIYSFLYPRSTGEYDVNGTFQRIGGKSEYWTTVILTVSCALLPNLFVKVVKSIILPTDVDIYQEIEKDKKLLDKLIEEGSNNGDDDIEGGFKSNKVNENNSDKKDNIKSEHNINEINMDNIIRGSVDVNRSLETNNNYNQSSNDALMTMENGSSSPTSTAISMAVSNTTTLSPHSPTRLRSKNSLDNFSFPKQEQKNNEIPPPSYHYHGSGNANADNTKTITPKSSFESFSHLNHGNNGSNMETLIEETEDDLQSKRSSGNLI